MSFIENIDRKKLQQILLIVIAALTVIALVLLMIIIIGSLSSGLSNGFTAEELTSYTVTEKDYNTGSLILADDAHPFAANSDLINSMVNCQEFRNGNRAEGVTKGPYYTMNAVQLSNISTAMTSAHKMLTDAEAQIKADDLLIKYGYNADDNGVTKEYQTGMLMYLTAYDETTPLNESYVSWFDANAAKYGFIKSFEYGYRYVGAAHAKYISEEEITLAEYIEFLKEKTSSSKVLKVETDDGEYAIYYVACKVGDSIDIPKQITNADGTSNNTYEISGTNEGGVIVTVKIK